MTEDHSYEILFNKWLDPFKAMLASKKKSLSKDEWRNLVERTRNGIIINPDQYLGRGLPEKEIVETTVSNIFNDFLEREEDI